MILLAPSLQFPRVEGLGSHQYGIAVCLTPGQSLSNGMLLGRQSARTRGANSDSDGSSTLELVTWNEIFFFKADPLVSNISKTFLTDVLPYPFLFPSLLFFLPSFLLFSFICSIINLEVAKWWTWVLRVGVG